MSGVAAAEVGAAIARGEENADFDVDVVGAVAVAAAEEYIVVTQCDHVRKAAIDEVGVGVDPRSADAVKVADNRTVIHSGWYRTRALTTVGASETAALFVSEIEPKGFVDGIAGCMLGPPSFARVGDVTEAAAQRRSSCRWKPAEVIEVID